MYLAFRSFLFLTYFLPISIIYLFVSILFSFTACSVLFRLYFFPFIIVPLPLVLVISFYFCTYSYTFFAYFSFLSVSKIFNLPDIFVHVFYYICKKKLCIKNAFNSQSCSSFNFVHTPAEIQIE